MSRKNKPTGTTDANSDAVVPSTRSCEILTVAETAALLKVPVSSIYEWTRYRGTNRGTPLPHRKIGKYIRVLKSELTTWLLALPHATNTRKRKYARRSRDGLQMWISSKSRPSAGRSNGRAGRSNRFVTVVLMDGNAARCDAIMTARRDNRGIQRARKTVLPGTGI